MPDRFKPDVVKFLEYFETCAKNRNAIMHSFVSGAYTQASPGERGLLLSKYSRQGDPFSHEARLADLRRVADETMATKRFGDSLQGSITLIVNRRRKLGISDNPLLDILQVSECPAPTKLKLTPYRKT
jgi:hypothetical protein